MNWRSVRTESCDSLGSRREALAGDPLLPLLFDLDRLGASAEKPHESLSHTPDQRHDHDEVEAERGSDGAPNLEASEHAATVKVLGGISRNLMRVNEVAIIRVVVEWASRAWLASGARSASNAEVSFLSRRRALISTTTY
jgi:hypothetical protein